jgi:hypothetical protein
VVRDSSRKRQVLGISRIVATIGLGRRAKMRVNYEVDFIYKRQRRE